MKQAFFIAAFLFFFLARALFAAESDTQLQLDTINGEIESQNTRLTELRAEESQLQVELRKIQSNIKTLNAQKDGIEKELQGIVVEKKKLEEGIAETERKIEWTQSISLKRIRTIYMNRRETLFEHLVSSGQSDEFGRNALYLRKIRSADLDLLLNLNALKTEHHEQSKRLDAIKEEKAQVSAKLDSQRKVLEGKASEKKQLASALKLQTQEVAHTLDDLKEQAKRLEDVIRSLTSEPSVPEKAAEGDPKRVVPSIQDFVGKGLKPSTLEQPLEGKIVRKFGKYTDPELKTPLVSKGLEYTAPPGSPVKAVSKGKVVYFGKMPVFGNVVILDHGARDYTLYGRLANVSVKQGDIVDGSELIGSTGEDIGSNFYFEVRRNGLPVNPKVFFRTK